MGRHAMHGVTDSKASCAKQRKDEYMDESLQQANHTPWKFSSKPKLYYYHGSLVLKAPIFAVL